MVVGTHSSTGRISVIFDLDERRTRTEAAGSIEPGETERSFLAYKNNEEHKRWRGGSEFYVARNFMSEYTKNTSAEGENVNECATGMRSLKPKVHAHPGNAAPEPRPTPPFSSTPRSTWCPQPSKLHPPCGTAAATSTRFHLAPHETAPRDFESLPAPAEPPLSCHRPLLS